jgi:hypothetical protein
MRPHRAPSYSAVLCLAVAMLVVLTGCLRVREDQPAAVGKPIAAAQFAGPTNTPSDATPAASPAATATVAPAADASPTAAAAADASPTAASTAPTAAEASPTAAGTPSAAASPSATTVAQTPTAAASPSAQPTIADPYLLLFPDRDARDEEDGVERDEGQGNRSNIIRLANRRDGQLRIKGRVQLNRIPGDEARPINYAIAYSSCTGCKTFAVALQLDLISKTAHTIAPENAAIAVNYECTGCVTVARAVQFVRQVDDPRETPDDVRDAIKELDHELKRLHSEQRRLSVTEANARIEDVIARFKKVAQSSMDDVDDRGGRAERKNEDARHERGRGRN